LDYQHCDDDDDGDYDISSPLTRILDHNCKYTLEMQDVKYFLSLPINKPKVQRQILHEKINDITNYQIEYFKKNDVFDLKTPIIIGKLDTLYYILDGQHRTESIKYLNETNLYGDFEVFVSIENFDNEEELVNAYVAINKNTPVDLPENITDWTHFSSDIADFMATYFKQNIRNTTKYPNSPYFNISTFSEYLNKYDVAKRVNKNYKLFIAETINLNNFYKQTYKQTIIPKFKSNVGKHIEKTKSINNKNPCFLSLYKKFEWVEKVINKITTGDNYATMNHVDSSGCHPKIGQRLKMEVWKRRFTTFDNNSCPICQNIISWETFHCGHITSKFYNGPTVVSNLEPICQKCNLDMGIENLYDYADKYRNIMSMC
jgi:hypothetical protein